MVRRGGQGQCQLEMMADNNPGGLHPFQGEAGPRGALGVRGGRGERGDEGPAGPPGGPGEQGKEVCAGTGLGHGCCFRC